LAERGRDELPAVAVDNDVLIKAASYQLTVEFWPSETIAVLGAARYVVVGRIDRMSLAGDRSTVRRVAIELIDAATELEPTDEELRLATQIETRAQRAGLSLDPGESQLAAIVIGRSISLLETGDKRAIQVLEALLEHLTEVNSLCGRVRSLEQKVLRCADAGDPNALAHSICAEPDVDKALSICCHCYSPATLAGTLDRDALESYIQVLRSAAPRVLEA
jgi:predicted nucleic acid-binding protein